MAISSKEKDTAVAPKETAMDPIETKEALPRKAEVLESLIRDNSKSKNGLFVKNRKEESYNDSTENEGEDLVLPQRGQVQRNFRHNAAPQSAYLTKWKPRDLFRLLIGLFLISGVAGHGERDNPNDPLIINTRKRTLQEGDEYLVTEWPRSDDKQSFPFNVLIGENYDCIQQSFTDDSLSICTLSLKNSANCGLSLKSSAEKHQLVYPMVVHDFTYCIFQNAINNYTILSGTVSVVPNKTSDTGNEESPTVNPTTEATTCKPAASCNNGGWYAFGGLLAVGLLALAFFIGQQIYKNRGKSGDNSGEDAAVRHSATDPEAAVLESVSLTDSGAGPSTRGGSFDDGTPDVNTTVTTEIEGP